MHSFVTTAMKTIKSKRVVTSETEGKNPYCKKESWRTTWKAHRARKANIFATPLQTFLAGQQVSLYNMEYTFSCCPAHNFDNMNIADSFVYSKRNLIPTLE